MNDRPPAHRVTARPLPVRWGAALAGLALALACAAGPPMPDPVSLSVTWDAPPMPQTELAAAIEPAEWQLRALPGVSGVRARFRINQAEITVDVDPEHLADTHAAIAALREQLELPEGTIGPRLRPSPGPVVAVAIVVGGPADVLARARADAAGTRPGVGSVTLREVEARPEVQLDPDRLAGLGLTPRDVLAALQAAPAPDTLLTVAPRGGARRNDGATVDPDTLLTVALPKGVRLGDVATVSLAPSPEAPRIDGRPGALVEVRARPEEEAGATDGVLAAWSDLPSPPDPSVSVLPPAPVLAAPPGADDAGFDALCAALDALRADGVATTTAAVKAERRAWIWTERPGAVVGRLREAGLRAWTADAPPLEVIVAGDVERAGALLPTLKGVAAVHPADPPESELVLQLDHDALVRLGLTPAEVTSAIRIATTGAEVGGVRVRLPEVTAPDQLATLQVAPGIPLARIATHAHGAVTPLRRLDGAPAHAWLVEVDGDRAEVGARIADALEQARIDADVR